MLKSFRTEGDISYMRKRLAPALVAQATALVVTLGVITTPVLAAAKPAKASQKAAHKISARAANKAVDRAPLDKPTDTKPVKLSVRPATRSYIVRSGDNLTSLARRFDLTIGEIRLANPSLSRSDVVRVGSAIRIPVARIGLPAAIRSNPERLRLRRVIRKWSAKNQVPADLVEATLYLESGWNQKRVSSTGAIGVGQLMPATSAYIKSDLIGPRAGGTQLNPANTEHNIRMSARYLRQLLKITNGNVEVALHGYYQGFGSIAANGLYADSKDYARSVQALRRRFRADLTGI